MTDKDFSDLGFDGGEVVPFESGRAAREPTPLRRTDSGNARRLVSHFGKELRHCAGLGWLVWDGGRWARDADGGVVRRAMRLPELMRREENPAGDDGLEAHARKSESRRSLEATVCLGSVQAELVVSLADLDRHAHLLNVANGTLDLGSLTLRPHRREDLLTQCSPVEYHPNARSDRFRRYLTDLTGGDTELEGYLQRVAGYCLWGARPEKAFFVLLGPPDTGKTTLLEALLAVTGSYGMASDFQTFLASRHGSVGARPDIAAMRGKRIVVAAEVAAQSKFDSALLKRLTGGDTVVARHLYREPIEFRPTAAYLLGANALPAVDPSDEALLERMHVVPCRYRVPPERRDPTLAPALRDPDRDAAAVLAWAAEGTLQWQRLGLRPPPSVAQERSRVRLATHPLAGFFQDCCSMEAGAEESAADLHGAYLAHHAQEGLRGDAMSRSQFGRHLSAAGLTSFLWGSDVPDRRAWRGIRLLAAPDRPDP